MTPLAEVLGRPAELWSADPQNAFGVKGSVGECASALGFPQDSERVDRFAAVVQGAQGAVDLLVAYVDEVTGAEPPYGVEELIGAAAEAAEEELLVGEDFGVDRWGCSGSRGVR